VCCLGSGQAELPDHREHVGDEQPAHPVGEAGDLTRAVSPTNRRERTVALTDRGHKLVATIGETVREVEAEWKQALGIGEYQRLRSSLESLNAALRPDE
jgi:DNA-binding MarR family transcriptional regulator